MRNTRLEVDLTKFKRNIQKIREYCPNKELMPVIKANAYGTYINRRLDILNDFNIVAVAIVDEAINLRKLGYTKDIFVLNQPSISEINEIIEYDLIVGTSSEEFIDECLKENMYIRCHLEIETGMNRTGINIKILERIIDKIKDKLKIEVVYTHFSSSDFDDNYTKKQIEIF